MEETVDVSLGEVPAANRRGAVNVVGNVVGAGQLLVAKDQHQESIDVTVRVCSLLDVQLVKLLLGFCLVWCDVVVDAAQQPLAIRVCDYRVAAH